MHACYRAHRSALLPLLLLDSGSSRFVRTPRDPLNVLATIPDERTTGEALQIEEGALYPALHRLEAEGLLASKWGISEKGRRAKLYGLTKRGHAELEREMDRWRRHTNAVERVLIKASPVTT